MALAPEATKKNKPHKCLGFFLNVTVDEQDLDHPLTWSILCTNCCLPHRTLLVSICAWKTTQVLSTPPVRLVKDGMSAGRPHPSALRPSLLKARRQQTFHASMPLVMVEARAVSVTISTLNKSCDAVYLQMACTAQELSDSRKKAKWEE